VKNLNLLEKAIAAVSPITGMKRAAARRSLEIMNSGYGNYGASRSKNSMQGWNYSGGNSKRDIEDHLPTLRMRSRDIYYGVPIATGAVKTMRTNVVGAGLFLKSQIDSEFLGLSEENAQKIQNDIEREFALWAESEMCDAERQDNFYELQQLAFLNWLLSGDVIVLLPSNKRVNAPYNLRIRLVEADRVCTPPDKLFDFSEESKIIDGVEINKDGEVTAYHIKNTHPLSNSGLLSGKWAKVEAFGKTTGRKNIIHLMNRERIGQRRGVPYLAPIIESLKQLGRYQQAEIDAAVINALWAVIIEKGADNNDDEPFGSVVNEISSVVDKNNQTNTTASEPQALEFSSGSFIDLAHGEKPHMITPGRPNPNFDSFVTAYTRHIGTSLEMPYEVLIKHFASSYSASRAALLELWKSVRMYRSWFASDFCQSIYEEWLAEAVAIGRISAQGFFSDPAIRKAYSGSEWNGPAQGLLNPVHEVKAAILRIENGLSTRDREAQEMNGSDFYKNVQSRRREEELMREVDEIKNPVEP